MAIATQITLTAQSRPGVLAKVSSTLAAAGVNIVAICAGEAAGRGRIRLLVSDPAKARRALAAAKLRPREEKALVLTLGDRPGALARVAERLAKARVNITCAYATGGSRGRGRRSCQVVLVVANPAKARKALR